MQYSVWRIKTILAIILISSPIYLNGLYDCLYSCTTNPLAEAYPNQNMCELLATIPPALKNLPYAMYPNCDIYNTNRFGFNKRFNYFPASIILPETESQLIDSFLVLKQNHLPFAVRSGGHCFEPGSLSSGYIIDMRNFDAIIPDVDNNQVYVGAGCKLGDVITTLGNLNYAIPTGTCPAVGVTGLALGGGIGFLVRLYGLTSDSILSIRLLVEDGSIIDVNAFNYPDLFWALCGAGANSYGIVIGFTFKMYSVPVVSFITLTWQWDPEKAAQIFKAWQKWFPTLPDTITTECRFTYRTGTSRVSVTGLKVGSKPFTEWQNVFSKFNPTVEINYHGNYIGAATAFASTPTPPFSKVKSKFLFEPLSSAGLKTIVEFYSLLQKRKLNIRYNFFIGSLGGEVGERHPESSYFPRHAFAWMFQFAYWSFEDQSVQAIAILNQIYCDLEQYLSPYSYSNLVDYDLGDTYLHAYYGKNVNRLIRIKNIYDPENIFTWKQGIPLNYCCPA